MKTPEGWQWLDELPSAWDAPDDIKAPTRYPLTNLAIQMLSSGMLGNDIVALLGTLLAEDAKFNMWSATAGRSSFPPEVLFARAIERGHATGRLYDAWRSYVGKLELNGRRASDVKQERAMLVETLRNVIATTIQLQDAENQDHL